MNSHHRQPKTTGSGSAPGRALLAVSVAALVLALLSAAAVSAGAVSGKEGEIGRLRAGLNRMTRLANRRLRPAAQRLAQDLPAERDRLARLREPASTAQAQIKVTLTQLQEMSALKYDPHYPLALVAAGRAYIAVSGQDPLTGTTVNPEYLGLERELATAGEGLGHSAEDAAGLSAAVKSLREELSRSQRHARRIERQLRSMRARTIRRGRR